MILMLLTLAAPALTLAQAPGAISIHVREAAGIRRSGYPVNARLPFVQGSLKDAEHVRLLAAEREVGAQFGVESRWPDQSVQWLAVDFNASLAPLENQTYRVEYGDQVKAGAPPRGLAVSETPDGFQAGSVRFNKAGAPLVMSVRYRQEDIGSGVNGFVVGDTAGMEHDLSTATGLKAEVVKPGPIYVMLRYTGRLAIDAGYSVPFTITAEMPSGKTWVKYSASVEDPARRVRDISFNSPLALGTAPVLWDFGTGSWSYGSFRNPTDSVVLTQTVKPEGNDWQIKSGAKGQETAYEVAAGSRPKVAEGWGHLQDAKEVIAFGFDNFGREPGIYSIAFDATGQSVFRFAPAQPAPKLALTIYQHYVASPTPIGAVTSPVSMLNGLAVTLDGEVYTRAGVPRP